MNAQARGLIEVSPFQIPSTEDVCVLVQFQYRFRASGVKQAPVRVYSYYETGMYVNKKKILPLRAMKIFIRQKKFSVCACVPFGMQSRTVRDRILKFGMWNKYEK